MPEIERAEVVVARLEERFSGFEKLFARMVIEQERMAECYEELVKSQSRLALVESEIVTLKDGQREIWKKIDALTSSESKRAEKWLGEIMRTALSIAAALLLYHFGVHSV